MDENYYIPPRHVISPKANWRLIRVLHDGGFGGWSVAEGQWGEGKEWSNVLAIRWNGNERTHLGMPQSRGLPVWFVVPGKLEAAVREAIA